MSYPRNTTVGPFYAVLMSGSDWKKFDTYDEANNYIESRRCWMCREQQDTRLHEGGRFLSCDAEWDIWSQEEVNEHGPLPSWGQVMGEVVHRKKRWGKEITIKGVTFQIGGHAAGLICVYAGNWCLHLLVRRKFWHWGWSHDWELYTGLGPLFLFCAEW